MRRSSRPASNGTCDPRSEGLAGVSILIAPLARCGAARAVRSAAVSLDRGYLTAVQPETRYGARDISNDGPTRHVQAKPFVQSFRGPAAGREPGIHNPVREYRFRARLRF